MIESLLLPFEFGFMQRAFLMALIVAVPMALLSCFLVLKGWALIGDAVSHAALPGVVLAHLLGLPLLLGAFAAGLLSVLATGFLAANSRVKPDTVMGVVFSGMFGLGLVLIGAITTEVHLDQVLLGNLLGVGPAALTRTLCIALPVTALLLLGWKDLRLLAFDPAQARAAGLATGLLHHGLLAMLALMTVTTLSASGMILAVALLVTPGATAFLLVRSFAPMLLVAVLVAVGSMAVGLMASFHLDTAPAPTIILVLSSGFGLAFLRRARRQARREG